MVSQQIITGLLFLFLDDSESPDFSGLKRRKKIYKFGLGMINKLQLGPCSWSAPHVSVAMNINLAVMTLVPWFLHQSSVYVYMHFSHPDCLLPLFRSKSNIYNIKYHKKKHITKKQPAPRNIRNRQKKFDGNINKRGNVSIGKAGEHVDDPPISKSLIAFFVFVVVGSSIVQILRMFQTSVPNLSE